MKTPEYRVQKEKKEAIKGANDQKEKNKQMKGRKRMNTASK